MIERDLQGRKCMVRGVSIAAVGPGAITAMARVSDAETTYYVTDHSKVVPASSSSLTDIINPAGYTTLATLRHNIKFSEYTTIPGLGRAPLNVFTIYPFPPLSQIIRC
ncbi:hypothetical protein BDQ17DRAFT_1433021 [Cyathus striatus]|nr:hypothetical protein BDQ17DRAFT_1433021 [Cyathus striatus]